ncbi:MAG TPA: hypothetical protein VLK84_23110 [Longimicrobium sp.]|nr:hypothetical protein [Longimicrobium sp.]
MTSHTFMRSILALVVAGGLFGTAPAAAGQALILSEGTPIPYQVKLPVDWGSVREDGVLIVGDGTAAVIITAQSLAEGDEEEPLPGSDAAASQQLIDMILSSDSVLMGMLTDQFATGAGMDLSDGVREMRTLGGQRAAYLRGRYNTDGEEGWIDAYLAIKNSVVYILAFRVPGDDPAPYAPLFTRIHESFVLANARR